MGVPAVRPHTMTDRTPPTSTDRPEHRLHRRQLLTLGSGAALAALAGCSGAPDGGGGGGYGGGGGTEAVDDGDGTFRLLISDQPVAIDEFDRLDVTLSAARVFPAGGEADDGERGSGADDETATDGQEATDGTDDAAATTASPTATDPPDGTETDDDDDDEDEEADEGDEADGDGDRGFRTLDLGGTTVDLTKVVGDRAVSVFEGGLPAGAYTKVELETTAVEGVVDGEAVDVKLPSEKLQITKPFEVTAGGTLSFVFDITVVRKGNGGYNLLPVVGESGVVGRDVEVEEVPAGGEEAGEAGDTADDPEDGQAPESPDGGPPDDAGAPSTGTDT